MSDAAPVPAHAGSTSPVELYPIREVSRLTGVNPVTLRAWERRYALICPTRTDSGHRLYSLADIERVRSILCWIERGVPVSKVGGLLDRPLPVAPRDPLSDHEWQGWQHSLQDAVARFDTHALQRLYAEVFAVLPLPEAFEQVLLPVWQSCLVKREAFGGHSQWLLLDTFLRARVLQRLYWSHEPAGAPLLLAALPGEQYELELLVLALLLSGGEHPVSLLPPGQPLDELVLVAGHQHPALLVLCGNRPADEGLARQLLRLAAGLPCALAVAGHSSDFLADSLAGSSVACLGSQGRQMRTRLEQLLAGRLDT